MAIMESILVALFGALAGIAISDAYQYKKGQADGYVDGFADGRRAGRAEAAWMIDPMPEPPPAEPTILRTLPRDGVELLVEPERPLRCKALEWYARALRAIKGALA